MNANKRTDMEGIVLYSDNANRNKKTHVEFEVIFKTGIIWRIDNCGAETEVYLVPCH